MSGSPATASACPCGTGEPYDRCCGPIHLRGAGLGATAEQLMRARYSAHVRGDAAFLASSWHPDTRPDRVTLDPTLTWQGLTVVATEAGGGLDNHGTVTFEARFTGSAGPGVLREHSTFTRVDGRWVYVEGN